MSQQIRVYVYPGSINLLEPKPELGTVRVRHTEVCTRCKVTFHLEYDEPFGHCECGTTEWYD